MVVLYPKKVFWQAIPFINTHVTLPDTKVDLLIKFLDQNNGKLSKKKREKEFEELTNKEVLEIEDAFQNIFMDV